MKSIILALQSATQLDNIFTDIFENLSLKGHVSLLEFLDKYFSTNVSLKISTQSQFLWELLWIGEVCRSILPSLLK